ncbi:hypothetical protein BDZ89DRAFT_1137928 [Hymenopellis radicata]|nr:hypothetical protein BDZ89DRAFT_1137928 [Hymenopellis radicata]
MVGIDCENVLKLFTFCRRRFRKSGFVKKDGSPITHVEMVRYMTALLEDAERLIEIELYHIGGHSGSEGNEGADFLAKRGAERSWAPPEPDWDVLERRVRRKLADLKAEEEAWAERKRKPADEQRRHARSYGNHSPRFTRRQSFPQISRFPALLGRQNTRSVTTRGSVSDNSDNESTSSTSGEEPGPESSQASTASTSSTLYSTDSDLPPSLPQSTGSKRMENIQAGLAMRAAARERRWLDIKAALASIKETVPEIEQGNNMALRLEADESLLTAQTSTSSAAQQMAVLPDRQATSTTNADFAAVKDLEPTQFAEKNVRTSSLPLIYTPEELALLASCVDDLDDSDTESNGAGLGPDKASQKSTSSSVYTPEELAALADLPDDDWDDIDSDAPGPAKTSKKVSYTDEELAEMAACLDDSSDFELDD